MADSAEATARLVWHRAPISDAEVEPEVQKSFRSDNGPGSLPTAKDEFVKYARNGISGDALVAARAGYLCDLRR